MSDGIPAQGDEIRNLFGIDAIARAYLIGTDARHLASTNWIEDSGAVRGELECVAVAARDEDSAAALLFFRGSGGEKIIRLEACRLSILKAAGGYKFWQHIELFKDGVIEFTPALIVRQLLMSVGRDFQRVPGDQHRTWLLLAVETQQYIGKAEDGTGRFATTSQDGFRQSVIGAVRE